MNKRMAMELAAILCVVGVFTVYLDRKAQRAEETKRLEMVAFGPVTVSGGSQEVNGTYGYAGCNILTNANGNAILWNGALWVKSYNAGALKRLEAEK